MKRIIFANILAGFIFICFAQAAVTQPLPKDEKPLLQVTISSDKKTYKEGEKIMINVEWKNISDKEIAKDAMTFFYIWNFHITGKNGKQVVPYEECGLQDYMPEYISLKPNETYTLTQEIPNAPYLSPGKYHITKPRLSRDNSSVESNTIEIWVVK